MSYLNRDWMTAGVAVVKGHTDQGHKLKSGMKSFQQSKKAFVSASGSGSSAGVDHTELRPFFALLGSNAGGFFGGDDRRKQSDESIRQVMYMNCWGPS